MSGDGTGEDGAGGRDHGPIAGGEAAAGLGVEHPLNGWLDNAIRSHGQFIPADRPPESPDERRKREKSQNARSVAIALALVCLALLFYAATIVRMGAAIANHPKMNIPDVGATTPPAPGPAPEGSKQ